MKKIVISFILILTLIGTAIPVFADKGGNGADKNQKGNNGSKSSMYTDLKGHWAETIVKAMAEKNIVKGANGKFLPNKNITRAELAVMLHRALDIQNRYLKAVDITEYFDDVKNTDWFAPNLYDLVTAGIMDIKGHFKPNTPVSREEFVHYIINTYAYKNKNTVKISDINLSKYEDWSKIKGQYRDDVKKAIKLGLIEGNSKKQLNPNAKITRAEAVAVIFRLVNILDKQPQNESVYVTPGYRLDDKELEMYLEITNTTNSIVKIKHTSTQLFYFEILNAQGKVLYSQYADKKSLQTSTTPIGSGKTVTFSHTLDKKRYGEIIEEAKYIKGYINGNSDQFTINNNGYEIDISDKYWADVKVVPSYEKTSSKFRMKLEITNKSNSEVEIIHNSGQKYDFALFDKDRNELYRWSDDMFFTQAITSSVLKAGKTIEFFEELSTGEYKNILEKAVYLKGYLKGYSEDFKIEKEGYEIKIR